MDSLRQFFSYMHDVSFPYVVLRNWDNLPEDIQLGEHSDLDLLVYDFDHFFELFPKAERVYKLPRVRTRIPIGDSFLYADIRYIGDDYYPESFEKSLIAGREWNERGFFTPNYECHTVALAYHAVHHKDRVAPEYKKHLGDATIAQLLESLKSSNVGWVEPKDKSVGRYHGYWKGATSVVEKRDGFYFKKQQNYTEYPLIENELDILSRLNGASNHFPMCRIEEGGILIEDCGEKLTQENIPLHWRDQMGKIIYDLSKNGIQHRDIRLDNLTVRDGVIRLIDFGWAVPKAGRGGRFDKLENDPPSCLGMPNKPSYGFDDEYSMGRVIKQIEYMLEEAEVPA